MNLPLSYTACTYDNNKSCRNIYSLVMQMGNELCLSYPSLHSSAKQEILVGGQSWKLSLVWITGIWRACEKFFRTGFASFSSLIPGRTNFFTVFSCDFSQKSFKMGFSWRTPFFSGLKSQHLPGQCGCVPWSQMSEVHFETYQQFVKTHAVAMHVTSLCPGCLWAQSVGFQGCQSSSFHQI